MVGGRKWLSLQEVKPQDAAKAVRTLVRYIEQLEEELLNKRADKVQLNKEELAEIKRALSAVRHKREGISLDEFNRKHHVAIQSHGLQQGR